MPPASRSRRLYSIIRWKTVKSVYPAVIRRRVFIINRAVKWSQTMIATGGINLLRSNDEI